MLPIAAVRHRVRRRWVSVAIAASLVLVALAIDLARPPTSQLTAKAALAAIRCYQSRRASAAGRLGIRCRFEPSCSDYAATVIARFGVLHGGWLAGRRLLRCGPWTPAGTFDPPPGSNAQDSSRRR